MVDGQPFRIKKLYLSNKMHIIFGHASLWQLPIMKLLRYFKFKIFYIYIDAKTSFKKDQIARKLKENNFFPLPIEFEKKISPKASNVIIVADPEEFAYKKNLKLVPDRILKKYCNLFSINNKKIKKLRLLLQVFISLQQTQITGRLAIWSAMYPSKKIIYVSFKFINFYNPEINNKISNVIIPLDFINFFKKIVDKMLSIFIKNNNNEQKNETSNNINLNELSDKTVAFIPHKGLIFGSKVNKIIEKTLYYSDDVKSCLNKYNILHLDYSDYPSPEKNICWVSLNQIKIKNIQIFLRTLTASAKTFYLIRSWYTFLGWLLCIHQYYKYIKYYEVIKKFKNLKVAIIDYDTLCPKPLILALEKNNIKTVATQERPITTFFTSYVNVMLDTYYTASEHISDVIKKSKYYDIKNIIPVGQYRSDYITLYREKIVPEEISKAKENGKKIIIVFGYQSAEHWFDSHICPVLNWSAQIDFLEDCIRLARNLSNSYIILRYKELNWSYNKYFEKILNKITNCENISISSYSKKPYHSYKLCAHSDLVIAKHTSIADECLSKGIPVLFHEYTHNSQKIMLDFPNYLPSELICNNFAELLEKSKLLLFNNSSKLKNKITELNQTIYHVSEEGSVKNKIIGQVEKLISLT